MSSGLVREPPDPRPLYDMLFGTATSALRKLPMLRAALELEVWAAIGAGGRTADEIARIVGADPDATRRLLDALTVMRLLEKQGTCYGLPEWAEYALVPGQPTYLGDVVLKWLAWEGHGGLAEAIRTGKHPIGRDVTSEGSVSHFVPYFAVHTLTPRRSVGRYDGYWQALGVEPREGLEVLDLACGAGLASLNLARQHPGVRVVLQDWPEMLGVTLEVADRLGVQDQVSPLPGNMVTLDYGAGRFDIVRFGWITHFFGPDEIVALFRKARAALKPGGMLVVETAIADEGRCENEEAVLEGPWFYALTAKGDVYTWSDYERFAEQAGLQGLTRVRPDLFWARR